MSRDRPRGRRPETHGPADTGPDLGQRLFRLHTAPITCLGKLQPGPIEGVSIVGAEDG